MIDLLKYTAAFLATLGILVTIHEYGHFWVARRLGFKVLKFSVGFGRPLWQKTGKDGVQYIIAAIPLGGYVKMLDSREDPIAESERHLDFNQKPVLHRMAVVIAGPLANFLFAIAAFWFMLLLGVTEVKPILAQPTKGSIAAQSGLAAGMEIVSVDGARTQSWEKVQLALADRLGEQEPIVVEARKKNANVTVFTLDVSTWKIDTKRPNILGSLGLVPYTPPAKPIIANVLPDSAAAKAGLQVQDTFIKVADTEIELWDELVEIIEKNPAKSLEAIILRGDVEKKITITPEPTTDADGHTVGKLGIARQAPTWPEGNLVKVHYGIVNGFSEALQRTWQMVLLTFNGIKKLIVGLLPIDSISGVVSIAQGAGTAASYGIQSFLKFLALISVNLGLINLLPIPVLDGGHFMFYLYEWLRGKPAPQKVQEMGLLIGLVLILSIMFIAIYYDILRLQS